jgi:hypothetical protein
VAPHIEFLLVQQAVESTQNTLNPYEILSLFGYHLFCSLSESISLWEMVYVCFFFMTLIIKLGFFELMKTSCLKELDTQIRNQQLTLHLT